MVALVVDQVIRLPSPQRPHRWATKSIGNYSFVCWMRQSIVHRRSLNRMQSLAMDCCCCMFSCRASNIPCDVVWNSSTCMSQWSTDSNKRVCRRTHRRACRHPQRLESVMWNTGSIHASRCHRLFAWYCHRNVWAMTSQSMTFRIWTDTNWMWLL